MNSIINRALTKKKTTLVVYFEKLVNDIDNYINHVSIENRKNLLIDIRDIRKELNELRGYVADVKVFKDERY